MSFTITSTTVAHIVFVGVSVLGGVLMISRAVGFLLAAVAPLVHTVEIVVQGSSEEEVTGVDAHPVVTGVKHPESVWDLTHVDEVGEPMRCNLPTVKPEGSMRATWIVLSSA